MRVHWKQVCALMVTSALWAGTAAAADHADTPLLASIPRHDARVTDLHAFVRDGNLVMALSVDPAVPPSATGYAFSSDLTLRLHVDNDAAVQLDDPTGAAYGGTLLEPGKVAEEYVFEVHFDEQGQPRLRLEGLPDSARAQVKLFAGLRDDPFIRAPRMGRNVAAVVLELPLTLVRGSSSTLLVWGTSKVPELHGPVSEHAGLALRSQRAANDAMNTLRPRDHYAVLGMRPDVMILDLSRPIAFPNGRELADDVVATDPVLGPSEGPGRQTTNDRPFLPHFPYLAAPHPAR